jgi:outer membrane protein TolC
VDDAMLAPVAPAPQNIGSWQDALGHIRERSTEIAIARAQITRAEASSRTALAALLPQVNGSGNATYNILTRTIVFGDPNTFMPVMRQQPLPAIATVALTMSQSLLSPRAIFALGTARANEDVAHLSEADTKRTITLNTANAMVSVVSAERVAELNRTGLRTALERLDIASRRQAGGAATGLDVVRAQQDVEAARATLVTGDEQVRQSRETLGLALGIPSQVGIAPTFNAQALEDGTKTLCKPAASLEERTDIAVSRGQLGVAKRSLTDAWLQFSPTITAQSTIFGTSSDLVVPNPTWNLQAILSIPIWDGGARYGALRDARGQITQAEMRLEQTRRVATIQVTQATRSVTVAMQALEVASRARDLAAEVDRLVRRAFAEGSGTSLELVTAAAALRQAEITLAIREFDLLRARISAALAIANCDY